MTQELQDYLNDAKTIIEQASGDKYIGAGIYQIFINDSLVYIGKSKSMIDRIASHMYHMDFLDEKSNKYKQLRRARDNGNKIKFDVLIKCQESELDQYEGQYIRELLPPLNYQIPKVGGGFEVNRQAKTITYEQILVLIR